MKAADLALYASKDAGRNCVHLYRNGEVILTTGNPDALGPEETGS